jgi:hypothetical protein
VINICFGSFFPVEGLLCEAHPERLPLSTRKWKFAEARNRPLAGSDQMPDERGESQLDQLRKEDDLTEAGFKEEKTWLSWQ